MKFENLTKMQKEAFDTVGNIIQDLDSSEDALRMVTILFADYYFRRDTDEYVIYEIEHLINYIFDYLDFLKEKANDEKRTTSHKSTGIDE